MKSEAEVRIFNYMGQQVFEDKILNIPNQNNEEIIDLKELNKGIYILSITYLGETYTEKIVLMN